MSTAMNQSAAAYAEGKNWTPADCVHAIIQSTMKVTMAAGVSWRHAEADPMVAVRRCLYCKTMLPLEPSKDTTESEIEVVAVEIALMTDEEREAKLGIDQHFAFGDGFDSTYTDNVENAFPGTIVYNSGEQAAWLAAQIIQHEVEGDPT